MFCGLGQTYLQVLGNEQLWSEIGWWPTVILNYVHVFINGVNNNLMDNSIMAMSSMELRNRIITFHNNYCPLIRSSISISFDSKNAATATNQMLRVLLSSCNDRNYSEHELRTHLPLIISVSIGTEYVTVWAKTWYVCTQTEIHFIAPAYSYTK